MRMKFLICIITTLILSNETLLSMSIIRSINLPSDAKGWGSNNVTSSFIGDISGLYLNPATISTADQQISACYTDYLLDINSTNFILLFSNSKRSLAIGSKFVNYGNFDGYDSQGNFSGKYSVNDFILSATYTSNIKRKINYGISFIYFNTNIESITKSFFFSRIGIIIYEPKTTFSVGFSILSKLLAIGKNYDEQIPNQYIASVSKKLAHLPLRIGLQAESTDIQNITLKVGGEFIITNNFFLRWGTSSNRFQISTYQTFTSFFGGSSIGCGYNLGRYNIDLALHSLGEMGYIFSSSISIKI